MYLVHTSIKVASIYESKVFYKRYFNFHVTYEGKSEDREFCFIENNGHTLELIQKKHKKYSIKESGPVSHIAFLVLDLDSEMERLNEKLIPMISTPQTMFGYKVMFYKGINNETIEIMEKVVDNTELEFNIEVGID